MLLVPALLFSVGPVFAITAKASNIERAPARFPSLVTSLRLDSPPDFCGEVVPMDNPDVRERLEKELLLNLWDRAQMLLYIKRSGRYFPYIEAQLKARGMPDDLKYLAVIESALKPHAGSRSGAMGYWQFIRPTALRYGLRVDSSIDERRNIFTSTTAALEYLADLQGMFDSWSLAAAAYNMGEQGLKKRIRTQGVEDFHRLYLPLETQAYVFRAIAVKEIMANPERYGLLLEEADYYTPPRFDRVMVNCPYPVPVRVVADASGTYFKVIKDLNPQVQGDDLPKGVLELLVPEGGGVGFGERFAEAVAKLKPQVTSYVVRSGDNLTAIARRLKVSLSTLLNMNGLTVQSNIHPGQRLIIPR
ncbi:MAG: transglycosylase SLT domain-containing protein [Proteobacteria bacterium]|nr:transglycosylase SLT domain-containing protein [Pseudomonadota bacterium]MBU1611837.1 transglycosylase SLT domain-containing protein [Pseudomonadota bacterium]